MPTNIYGRTLIELISSVAILATLSTVALPNLRGAQDENARTQAVNQLISTLNYARSSAVFSRKVVTLCHGSLACEKVNHWNSNLLIFIDSNANGQLDPGDEVLHRAHIPDDFSWHWNRSTGLIQFEADGTTRAMNGTFTLCQKASPRRQIAVSLSGRMRSNPPKKGARC